MLRLKTRLWLGTQCVLFLLATADAAQEESHGIRRHVYAWGLNNAGQVGSAKTGIEHQPVKHYSFRSERVVALASGGGGKSGGHTLLTVGDGHLLASGDGAFGQLGTGDRRSRDAFVALEFSALGKVKHVAAGDTHSVAVNDQDEVFVWGDNARGQLGEGNSLLPQALQPRRLRLPQEVESELQRDGIAGVAAGLHHTVLWTGSGRLLQWGDNSQGQIAHPGGAAATAPHLLTLQDPTAPQVAAGADGRALTAMRRAKVVKAAAGAYHTLVLLDSGSLLAWGRHAEGQLGIGPEKPAAWLPAAVEVAGCKGGGVVDIAAGATHSVLLCSNGGLLAMGNNLFGQLGIPGARQESSPAAVPAQQNVIFTHLKCGRAHCLALTMTNNLFSWGSNSDGQLGAGDWVKLDTPKQVTSLSANRVGWMAAGAATSFALLQPGAALAAWGQGSGGQLGLPARPAAVHAATLVPGFQEQPPSVQAAAAGGWGFGYEGHSAFVLEDGRVWMMGWNAFGQLGVPASLLDSGFHAAASPQPQAPLLPASRAQKPSQQQGGRPPEVAAAALGQLTSLLVSAAGDVLAAGSNDCGLLGIGDFSLTTRDRFEVVAGLDEHVVTAAMGARHALALTQSGRVWTWGCNSLGQLGVGDHKDRASPQLVSELEQQRVVWVGAGQYHSLAIDAAGALFVWGYNRDYQLGLGDNIDRILPQKLRQLPGRVLAAAGGGYHTLALLDSGQVLAWGLNQAGQALPGPATAATLRTPQPVPLPPDVQGGSNGPRITAVAAGAWHSLALTAGGRLISWGSNDQGQLGASPQDCLAESAPRGGGLERGQQQQKGNERSTLRPGGQQAGSSAAGGSELHAEASDGKGDGKVPHGPCIVSALVGQRVVQVAAGAAHSLAVVEGT